ncbi:MAG TPA: hypothetical protein VK184_03665 [Nostocaceae cyanobacterium]|nr:hypothetical protein [Nostocaceae cyanobacterium]
MQNSSLSISLGLPPFSQNTNYDNFIIPGALAVLDFSDSSTITWDNTGTPSISSIKYKNNLSLSATATDKTKQPVGDSINGKVAAKFDTFDDYLQFSSRLTTVRTVIWIGRLHLTVDHFNDSWLGLTDDVGVYCGAGPTYALLDTAFTPSLWAGTWYLNGSAVTPTTTAAPIGSNFSLIMQTTSNGTCDYISRDRDFTARGLPIVLGEIQLSSQTFTESELLGFNTNLRTKWNF